MYRVEVILDIFIEVDRDGSGGLDKREFKKFLDLTTTILLQVRFPLSIHPAAVRTYIPAHLDRNFLTVLLTYYPAVHASVNISDYP